jgi:O-succinylhomoserine sulfhydrylase
VKTPESSGVLENHPQVNKVKYPFEIASSYEIAKSKVSGNIVAFEIKGGLEAGRVSLIKLNCVRCQI